MKPKLFDYLEYPDILAAWFEYQKEHRYGFSYRSFSRTAGIESPNYLQRVITRQRKLTDKYLPQLIAGIGLDQYETEYLVLLMDIEQCRDDKTRENLTTQLVQLRADRTTGKLTEPMLHYLSHWYYPVVRELIVLFQTSDPAHITQKIRPAISISDIQKSISFLIDNDYVTEINGEFRHTTPILTTGDEVISNIVNHYHRESLLLSAEDLTDSLLAERDVSSLILSLSEETFLRVKKEIQLFRKKLLQISEDDKSADRVYHLGFQFLPRSHPKKDTE